jgi:uncharacterized protein (TIGR02145 family)
MIKFRLLICLYFLIFLLINCSQVREKELYESVVFCGEEWMLSTLSIDKFRNGDIVPEAKTDEAWALAIKEKKPAWCYYNNDPELGKIHGKIYNWYAITDIRGLAPKGWRIADDTDWSNLTNCFNGQKDVVERMKLFFSDSTDFTFEDFMTYGGTRGGHGAFNQLNEYGRYFTTTEILLDTRHVWRRTISIYDNHILSFGVNKEDGLYVKCVKEK